MEAKKIDTEALWVLFRLNGGLYAVSSSCTAGIAKEPEQVTLVPDTKPYIRGITNAYGRVMTLVDLRKVFGMQTTKEEYEDFAGIIETAENAHKKWVGEFCRCAGCMEPFNMEKDPHRCAFGLWYDKYEAPIETVKKRMFKIRDPHYSLHHLGVDFDREMAKGAPNSEKLKKLAVKAKEIEKQILTCMDAAREAFRENYRTMMVEINLPDGQEVALIVDEIVGVEQIGQVYDDATVDKMARSRLVGNVASTRDGKELLFLIDEDEVAALWEESGVKQSMERQEAWAE